MGRTCGSPNINDFHWEYIIYHPLDTNVTLWSKKYKTLPEIHKDMKNIYTFTQLKSYASGTRRCPKHVIIRKIKEAVIV